MTSPSSADLFRLADGVPLDPHSHTTGAHKFKCTTDSRLEVALEAVLDATDGFIPLWSNGTTLRWRFNALALAKYQQPEAVKKEVRKLIDAAMTAWGPAAPVKLTEGEDSWDFEVVVRASNDCDINGCTLAQAFFPNSARQELLIFPLMFKQEAAEQVATLAHELGHVFGLRHFFADKSEKAWPSVKFGQHVPFTIMNYGKESVLTDADRNDLAKLYAAAWSGTLKEVAGTPIRLVSPYHTTVAKP